MPPIGNLPPPGGYPPPPPPPGGYTPPPPPMGGGYPMQKPATGYGYAPQVRYGGFWIRFVSIFIDGLIVGIPVGIVSAIVGAAVTSSSNNSPATGAGLSGIQLVVELLGLVVEIGYFVYFWGKGQTLAMRLFHLRVADATTGLPIGSGRAALRYVGYILSVIVCYIGLIWAAFDSRKQGWHDKIASTVVLQG
jgi:uncharacterized RDD family membrane protein YckC